MLATSSTSAGAGTCSSIIGASLAFLGGTGEIVTRNPPIGPAWQQDTKCQLPAASDALIFLIHFCNSPHSILEKAASLLVSLILGNCGALSGAGALLLSSAIST